MLAIFLIVTLAALGVYLVTVSTGQAQAVAQDVLASRAYQAARAGVEWGAFQILRNSNPGCTGSPLVFANPGLSGFRAVVTCTQAAETEGTTPITVYLIVSKGCNANPCTPAVPDPNYVERELQLTVTQ